MSDRFDIKLLFGLFLDDFYHAGASRIDLIQEEPPYKKELERWMCILGATAHRLANEYHLPIPTWTLNERYVLKEIYYAFDTMNPAFQKYLQETSLPEFKQRNLLLGDNILTRC